MFSSKKLHYAWIVAAVAFVTLLVGAATRASPSLLIVPLESEFQWSRATISFAIGVNLLLYGLIGPFAAAMMESFGVRRMMLGSLSAIGVGVALTPLMQQSWHLVMLWGVVVGAGAGGIAMVLAATVAARWFTARRGLVTGLLTSSAAAVTDRPNGATDDRPNGATLRGRFWGLEGLDYLPFLDGFATLDFAVPGVGRGAR